MDQRKRRRMQSNRESARRSRQRKQRHLDELTAQAGQLREENGRMLAALAVTCQRYLAVESENAVLRTRITELAARLQALNGILLYVNTAGRGSGSRVGVRVGEPWNQPIVNVALADMFQYC